MAIDAEGPAAELRRAEKVLERFPAFPANQQGFEASGFIRGHWSGLFEKKIHSAQSQHVGQEPLRLWARRFNAGGLEAFGG